MMLGSEDRVGARPVHFVRWPREAEILFHVKRDPISCTADQWNFVGKVEGVFEFCASYFRQAGGGPENICA